MLLSVIIQIQSSNETGATATWWLLKTSYDALIGQENVHVHNFDRIVRLILYARCCCICLVLTRQLIYNMTFIDHCVRSRFLIDLSCITGIGFKASWREKHDGVQHFSLPFLNSGTIFKSVAITVKTLKSDISVRRNLERSGIDLI